MIEKFLKTKIEENCPTDLKQKWNNWFLQLETVDDKVEIVKTEDTSFGKIIDFYFEGIYNTRIYSRLYYVNNSIKNNYPLIIYFHGSLSPMCKEWTHNDCLKWAEDGFSVVTFDARNQGGNTNDTNLFSFKDEYYINQGIDDLETNYCLRLYLDGVKLIQIIKNESIQLFKNFRNVPLISLGASQGGEMALVVTALTNDISLCVPDIPSGCALKERIINHNGKYNAVNDLKEKYPELDINKIYENLGYFDIVNFAHWIKCPVFSAVGFKDDVCPPEFFYQAYKKIKEPKLLYIYDDFGHGGFDDIHRPKKINYIKEYFKLK